MTPHSWLFSNMLYRLPLVIGAASAIYYLAVVIASLKFHFEKEPSAEFTPPVSMLKPVRGIEEGFYEALASHCRQDYPCFEIIFGVSDPNDPACEIIDQLRREFPQVPIRVIVAQESLLTNRKMNSLARMIDAAAYDVVLINDADIRVEPDYLRSVVRPLADETVGLVTCLYRGIPLPKFVSIFEALGIGGDFAGQVLLARCVEGVRFALGATMVTRKKQIAAIGGLARWGNYLADDYIFGNQIAAAGFRVHLSHTAVDTRLSCRRLSDLLRQQLRWARTVRISRPGGYFGLLLTFGIPFAALALVAEPHSAVAAEALAIAVVCRLLAAWASGVMVSRDRTVRRFFWLLPLRDFLALGVWTASFLGNKVVWRGERFKIEPGGKIRPA